MKEVHVPTWDVILETRRATDHGTDSAFSAAETVSDEPPVVGERIDVGGATALTTEISEGPDGPVFHATRTIDE
jgi:hypothetical protein